jgi:hypothetical protein
VGDSLPVFAKSDADQPSTLLVADFFFTDYRGLMEPFGTASGLTNPGQLIVEPLSSDLSAEMPLHRFAVRD